MPNFASEFYGIVCQCKSAADCSLSTALLTCRGTKTENVTRSVRMTSFKRYQAESNCCARFCRPMPHHSAMVPFGGFAGAKLSFFSYLAKFF